MPDNTPMKLSKLLEDDYLIILDTNVLLGLYRLSPDYADFALHCLDRVKNSIRIPYIVYLEFFRHNKKLYSNRQSSIKSSMKDSLNMISEHKKKVLNAIGVLERRNYPEIDELRSEVSDHYDKALDLLNSYFDEHSILTLISDTWDEDRPEIFLRKLQANQQIMTQPDLSEIYNICDDGEGRFKNAIPPGYKDARQKDGIRKYSDLIWWKEVIQYARKSRKNIILVTDDVKEDWWTIDEDGHYLFRSELISEFEKETKVRAGQNQGTQLQPLHLVSLISNDFYRSVAKSYGIPEADAIDIATRLTDDVYIENIQEDVFDDIIDDIIYSGTDYLDDSMTYIGSEGIEEWELEETEFLGYEVEERDGNTIYYRLKYHVYLSGSSHDYWGRDDDTKEIILSDPFFHEVTGEIDVLVAREVDLMLDYEDDNEYASAEIEFGDLSEVSYKELHDPEAYTVCSVCGRPLTLENDAGGKCRDCMLEE